MSLRSFLAALMARSQHIPIPSRVEARRLASKLGVRIERYRAGYSGWNVRPARGYSGHDPHARDHYAENWERVLTIARAYTPEATRRRHADINAGALCPVCGSVETQRKGESEYHCRACGHGWARDPGIARGQRPPA